MIIHKLNVNGQVTWIARVPDAEEQFTKAVAENGKENVKISRVKIPTKREALAEWLNSDDAK